MAKKIWIICLCLCLQKLQAQELYIFTEPASNVPAKSTVMRFNGMHMPMQFDNSTSSRMMLEAMFGLSSKWMLKLNTTASDMFQSRYKLEGAGAYLKYRFISNDGLHSHFRMAAFGKVSLVGNPASMTRTEVHNLPGGGQHTVKYQHYTNDLSLDGNQSGWSAGIVGTQLLHKLAVSGTLAYTRRMDNLGGNKFTAIDARSAMMYSLSAGYLVFPKSYKNYKQVNLNLYTEFLGGSLLDQSGSFLDMAPAVQLIFNSTVKLNAAYRFQLNGDINRYNTKQFLIGIDWSFLNTF